jgi:predicted O-methyltransferase YrrM
MPSIDEARASLRALCPGLGERAAQVLARMYSSTHLQGTEGIAEVGETRIPMLEGTQLHKLSRAIGARATLEIGFAFGFSTVWLLDSLPAGGRHVAIDPHERSAYAGVGLQQVQDLAPLAAFEWRQALSIHALSDDIRQGERYDLVFIDGNHRFDDVMVDFYLADQVLRPGGALALDDMWMPSVKTVASFIALNRAYQVVAQAEPNVVIFQKLADDTRDWRHFVPFQVNPK